MFNKKPEIKEIELSKHYSFMYENFVLATQHKTYLFLEKEADTIRALKFDSTNIKYGGPNDEARGAHPLTKFGRLLYGLYEVINSPCHSDSLFDGKKHYVACFKDVMFEITCRSFTEVELNQSDLNKLVAEELDNLID